MEKSQKIATQVYGYTICVVAVITFLIAVNAVVSAVLDRSDPLNAGWNFRGTPSLASFENYKMDILASPVKEESAKVASYVPDDLTLRAMYEAAKSDTIQKVMHQSNRSLTTGILSILISIVLFVTHWRWMHKRVNIAVG